MSQLSPNIVSIVAWHPILDFIKPRAHRRAAALRPGKTLSTMSRNEVKVRSRKRAVDVTEGGVERDSRIFPLQRFAQGRALSPGSSFWLWWLARWKEVVGSLKEGPWRRWRRRQREKAKQIG
jgi:hypothetical protein